MGKIISFSNQKGGVGKTTSAVNVAASLGILGRKVLLIDLDPQGNATSGVGISKKTLKYSTYDVLVGKASAADATIQTQFENLDIIPASITLAGAEYFDVEFGARGEYVPLERAKESYEWMIKTLEKINKQAD